MIKKGLTLAVMEDCGGGYLTAAFTDIPGSEKFFRGGLVAGTDEARAAFGVDPGIISRHGNISPEAAKAMAEVARDFLGADIGISTTAVEIKEEKPLGIAYIGISGRESREILRPQWKPRVISAVLFELRKVLLSM
jgi:PncC family amidohydrolase